MPVDSLLLTQTLSLPLRCAFCSSISIAFIAHLYSSPPLSLSLSLSLCLLRSSGEMVRACKSLSFFSICSRESWYLLVLQPTQYALLCLWLRVGECARREEEIQAGRESRRNCAGFNRVLFSNRMLQRRRCTVTYDTHTRTNAHMHTHTHTYTYIHMDTCAHTHSHTQKSLCSPFSPLPFPRWAHLSMRINTHCVCCQGKLLNSTHTPLHTHTHTYTHTHSHTHTLRLAADVSVLTSLFPRSQLFPHSSAFDAPRLARRAKVFAMTRVSLARLAGGPFAAVYSLALAPPPRSTRSLHIHFRHTRAPPTHSMLRPFVTRAP